MKSVFDMSGAERAAALLVSLGPGIASDILRHLDEESIEKITVEIAKIDRLTPEDREELSGEFMIELRKAKRSIQGGESKARALLEEAFGESKADEILRKIKPVDIKKEFEKISGIETDLLISILSKEHPQTIAVAMAYLPAEKSAAILKAVPRDKAKEVAKSVARKKMLSPDVVARVAQTINGKYDEISRKDRGFRKSGGLGSLIDILAYMTGDEERKILQTLDRTHPEISAHVRESVFAFEGTNILTNTEIRILIDEVNDDSLIALALKGAGDEIRFKFLRNTSQNRATDIIHEMDRMGAVHLSKVQEARDMIMMKARALHENGMIAFNKKEDIYVE